MARWFFTPRCQWQEAWELRVYLGADPVTGKQRYATRTVRSGKRVAQAIAAPPPLGDRERPSTRRLLLYRSAARHS